MVLIEFSIGISESYVSINMKLQISRSYKPPRCFAKTPEPNYAFPEDPLSVLVNRDMETIKSLLFNYSCAKWGSIVDVANTLLRHYVVISVACSSKFTYQETAILLATFMDIFSCCEESWFPELPFCREKLGNISARDVCMTRSSNFSKFLG